MIENTMVSEQMRQAIWQDLLDVARLVRYYEALSNRHRLKHSLIQFLLLASAFSGIAALLKLLPEIVQLIAGGLIAFLVAWDFVAGYARKAAVLHTINYECHALEIEWSELWAAINSAEVNDTEARERNKQLEEKFLSVTGWAGQADIRVDQKLNTKCEEVAYKVVAEQYAA